MPFPPMPSCIPTISGPSIITCWCGMDRSLCSTNHPPCQWTLIRNYHHLTPSHAPANPYRPTSQQTLPPLHIDFEEDLSFSPPGYNPEDFLEKSEVINENSAWALRHEIIGILRSPLQYRVTDPLTTWHGHEQTGLSAEQFMTFNTVILTLDAGYYLTRKTPLLGAQDWSTLSSA